MTEVERHKLILDHLSVIGPIASEYRGRGVDFDELTAIGNEALVLAARSYVPGTDTKFSTYAIRGIRQHLAAAIKSGNHHTLGEETAPAMRDDASEHVERLYAHTIYPWLVYELWSDKFDGSAESLHILFEGIQEKQEFFQQAFLTLRPKQQKIVMLVYLRDPPMCLEQAARELGISYLKAWHLLEASLKAMREHVAMLKAHNGRRFVDLAAN